MGIDTKHIDRIVDFWFGNLKENEIPSEKYRKQWWIKDSENDERIKDSFGDYLNLAIRGELDSWKATSLGTLALILLFDQFTRNIYRDTENAFSQDQKAVELCLNGINKAFDKELHPIQRIFYYMPLMHSEEMSMQKKSIKSFSNLANQFKNPEPIAKMTSGSFEYAMKHYEIVKRFGRYPHRNAILGRKSSPEETQFLSEPGSSF